MKIDIRTVGDLREALKHSEDDEPLIFDFEDETMDGKKLKCSLRCTGVGSSGGGRITVLWLNRPATNRSEYVI
jgi:hypothetical protein